MADEQTKQEPVAIESLTRESLKGKSVDELETLLQYMTSIRMVLQTKMELVHAIKEETTEIEKEANEVKKWSPEKRARMSQVLGGDHIAKDEKTQDGNA